MIPSYEALEFPAIINALKEHAFSHAAKSELDALTPCLNEKICRRKMAETTAAKRILESCGSPPLSAMEGLPESIAQAEAGAMLPPEQLTAAASFALSCKRLAAYLKRGESTGGDIAVYGRNLADLSELAAEIEACVSEDQVRDDATPVLKALRRKLEALEGQIRDRLSRILQSKKTCLAENFISIRGGHYVLPVQRRFQSQFDGTVIDVSGKGSTVFMEPSAISALQVERNGLTLMSEDEIRRILYTLSARIADEAASLRGNIAVMAQLDALFAKAKYSAAIHAQAVEIGGQRRLELVEARHPLLAADTCIPLNFAIDAEESRASVTDAIISGVIITGPNTGGKTVALKTVGLLTLMAQCGLHIPCREGSYIAMQDGVWCDIGDGQNISQNLSTFSGHITNVIHILQSASRDSLVLLDELGSGTDPAEGMGLAVAVLEELRVRGCMFLVTTHYPGVKAYAEGAPHVQTARMAFDRENLKPLYQLEMGKSGESCALYIAEKLGMPQQLLSRAAHEVYGTALPPEHPALKPPASLLERLQSPTLNPADRFSIGDSVQVMPDQEKGVVYRPADAAGNVTVQIKGIKCLVKHQRLCLLVPAAQLYPPDYDFSILFDTVANRKARHSMSRRFDSAAAILHEDESYSPYEQIDWKSLQ